ncbi:MAG TPA: hypothetical protein VF458_17175 [Ktedonobacteraceae bacterium]
MQQTQRPVRRGRTGKQQFVYGLMLTGLGIVLTIVFQFIAAATGSTYTVVFYGLTIIGIIYALIGLFRMIAKR